MINYTKYIDNIKKGISQRIIKLEFLDRNGQVVGESTKDILDGSLNVKLKANSRRSCSFTFCNKDGLYIPNEDSNIWVDRQFRLYTGRRIDGEDYYNLRGTFVISNPSLSSDKSNLTASINGVDKWETLNGKLGGTFEDTFVVNEGETITTVVKSLFTDKINDALEPIIYPSNAVIDYPMVKEPGSTYDKLLTDLASMLRWDAFYDLNGHFRFQPPIDVTKEGEVWNFGTNEVTYGGSTHTYNSDDIKNVVAVYGDNINSDQVYGIAEDTNIFSPFNIYKFGRKVHVITDDIIYNNVLAMQRAEYELGNIIKLQESVNIKCLPVDIINEGDIITIEDSANDLHRDRYQVQSISEGLMSDGTLTLEVWRERTIT